jgi:uncharacterized damage-inducible protein DinB
MKTAFNLSPITILKGALMHKYFADYLACLTALHMDIERAIDGLPQETLDWKPGVDMNTIDVLVVHLAGAERYWIGDVAGQEPSGRDRAAEFQSGGLDASELRLRLSAVLENAQGVLDRLALEDLAATRISPRDGREFTAGWALAHALEHTALHLGHIQITRQWWEQKRSLG